MKAGAAPPPFTAAQLEAICKSIADTDNGLTGSEIGRTLKQIGVVDPDPEATKWKRLYTALATRQNRDGTGDRVLSFIKHALDPARYSGREKVFQDRRMAVNIPLAFYGLEFGEDGKYRKCVAAKTLGEAEERAGRLRKELERRAVEPEVLAFCRAELLEKNYFHAVLEATKSISALIRSRTGLSADAGELSQQAFGGDDPVLRINPRLTETHRTEQRGFTNLLVGFFGMFRSTTAHAARIEWPMGEQDALDLLSLASLLLRRIKHATPR